MILQPSWQFSWFSSRICMNDKRTKKKKEQNIRQRNLLWEHKTKLKRNTKRMHAHRTHTHSFPYFLVCWVFVVLGLSISYTHLYRWWKCARNSGAVDEGKRRPTCNNRHNGIVKIEGVWAGAHIYLHDNNNSSARVRNGWNHIKYILHYDMKCNSYIIENNILPCSAPLLLHRTQFRYNNASVYSTCCRLFICVPCRAMALSGPELTSDNLYL